jgi:hypothetical protein
MVVKRPNYISEDGIMLDISKKWIPTEKQAQIALLTATQRLLVGGIRSGKTAGAIMNDLQYGLLRYPKSNALCLRKTFPELKAGPIEDFREHCPPELYSYHETNHVATFINGSRLVFGHCKNGKEEDVQQYLGTAYPFIVPDECAQFSPEAWMLLVSRNTVNPECMSDVTQPCGGCGDPAKCGYPCMPVPHITGCTNPFGDYWPWYRATFREKKPFEEPEGAKRDKHGRYWVLSDYAEPRLVYNPDDYALIHSTVLDNPHALKRDPGIIDRLNKMPPHLRDLYLLGYMEGGTGQYFSGAFSRDANVIDLKSDPDAIIWEPWQPVFGGWDWAIGSHWNALYFFTLAQVRTKIVGRDGEFGYEYRRKIVCFREYVVKDKMAREMAQIVADSLKYPDGTRVEKIHMIAFSHEKFSRQVEEHSPADVVSMEMVGRGLCPVSRGTTNRIGRATLMYQKLAHKELVVLSTCPAIIDAIPNLMADEATPLDVSKPDGPSKNDDCYDAFSLGLYGYFNPSEKPGEMREQERLDRMDPVTRHFAKWGNTIRQQKRQEAPRHRPLWMDRMKEK